MADAPDLEAALDVLYATPQDGFIAARDALVKQLRAGDAGAKAAAAGVKALRKPSVTAWALNQVARTSAEDLAALFAADAGLAQAQQAGSGSEALSHATRARREVVRRLVDAALAVLRDGGHPDSPGNRDRIAQTLTAVATDQAGREALRRGRLSGDLEPASLWDASPFGAAAPTAAARVLTGEESPPAPESPLRRQAADLQARAEVLAQAAAEAGRAAATAELQAQEAAAAAARLRQVADRAMDVAVASRQRAQEAATRAQEAATAAAAGEA